MTERMSDEKLSLLESVAAWDVGYKDVLELITELRASRLREKELDALRAALEAEVGLLRPAAEWAFRKHLGNDPANVTPEVGCELCNIYTQLAQLHNLK